MPGQKTYLRSLEKTGIRLGLSHVSDLMQRLGNPQNTYHSVLVGGTNGKGSTAAMLASILSAAGLKTGLYTSPHLFDFRERIKINGSPLTSREMEALTEEIKAKCREPITYFEFATALGFLYFGRKEIDIAVLEVGMGGRLDATNIVQPQLSIITNVSLEHSEYLGNNLATIAGEKAGIIKENGTCLSAVRQKNVIGVLQEQCRRKKCRLLLLGRDIKVRRAKAGQFNYYGVCRDLKDVKLPLIGHHQADNAALALGAIEVLVKKEFKIEEYQVRAGLSATKWAGRLEIIGRTPDIVLDGAHNPAGTSVLARALLSDFSFEKLVVIFGVLNDKDARGMIRKLKDIVDVFIFTRPPGERGCDPQKLAGFVENFRGKIEMINIPGEALTRALKIAGSKDLICVTGSLYLVAEVKKAFSKSSDK